MKSTQSHTRNANEFVEQIESKQALGFDLIDVKYIEGYWFGSYGNNIGFADTRENETDFFGTASFPKFQTEIQNFKNQGFELTDIDYNDGYWFGTFADGEIDSFVVTSELGFNDFERQINAKLGEGSGFLTNHLVDVEYADGAWVGVFNYGFGTSDYSVQDNYREFHQEVLQQKSQGLELINLEYNDDQWFGIYSDRLSGESIYTLPDSLNQDIDDFGAEIADNQRLGYDLINVESVDGYWLGIYKENTDLTNDPFPRSGTYNDPVNSVIQDQLVPNIPINFGIDLYPYN